MKKAILIQVLVLTILNIRSHAQILTIDSINYIQPSDSVTCNGQIQVYVSGGCTPYAFYWDGGMVDPYQACCGIYPFSIIDSCGSTLADTAYLCGNTSINTNITKNIFQLYPNPSTDQITVLYSSKNQPFSYEIYDVAGNKVESNKLVPTKIISLKKYQSGIYLVKISNGKEASIEKVVKE